MPQYSQTSVAQITMARLPWLIRTHFQVPTNFFQSLQKKLLKEIFFFYHKIICCVYSLELFH